MLGAAWEQAPSVAVRRFAMLKVLGAQAGCRDAPL